MDDSLKAVIDKTEAYRRMFPHTKDGLIYLNHSAVSPMSSPVYEAIQSHLMERHRCDIENYFPTLQPALQSARERIASFIGAQTAEIGFVPNTSYGLNLLAQGLTWQKGDRILLYDKEFPSNIYPFLNLQKKGVEIDFFSDHNGILDPDDIQARITPNTRLLSISYVQFLSGYRVNLKQLSQLCHAHNIIFSVDAIQGLGAMPLDFESDGIDFLACGGHKWAMSPMGSGFVAITPELLGQLDPIFVGWLSVENAWEMLDYDLILHPTAQRYELGTINWMGIIGLNEAFRIFSELGIDCISRKILHLTSHLKSELLTEGFQPYLNAKPEHSSGIVSVTGLHNVSVVAARLAKEKIEVSPRDQFIRVAPHFYNTCEEISQFVKALKHITTL
jgi:selenocysteine lyase/cysteine desulfurase